MTKFKLDLLDLSNSRSTTKIDSSFNSIEDKYNSRGLAANINYGKFSQLTRYPPNLHCHSNRSFDRAHTDNNGNIVELKKKIDRNNSGAFLEVRQLNSFDLSSNETALAFQKFKPRIDLEVVNKVLDRDHCIISEIVDVSSQNKSVFGSAVPNTASTSPESTRTLGPGTYDVLKWEKSKQCSQVPGYVAYRPPSSPAEFRDKKFSLSELSASTELLPDSVSSSRPSTTPTPGITIGKGPRFTVESPDERYKRFTGLLLSPDFDRKKGWGRSVCIKSGDHPRFKPLPPQSDSIVTPNFGPKASLERTVRDSRRYVGLFRPDKESSSRVSTATSVDFDPSRSTISPAVHGSIRVNEPDRPSAGFRPSARASSKRNNGL